MQPFHPVPEAARAMCCSRAQIYELAKRGELELVKLAGRTLVTTASLDRALANATPFKPSTKTAAATRARLARAARRSKTL